MSGNELFEVTLMLWGSVAGLFVLAGFVTGEWMDGFRELKEWIEVRRERSDRTGIPPHHPMPRPS